MLIDIRRQLINRGFFILFLSSLLIFSCKSTKDVAQTQVKDTSELEHALLWKVSGNDLDQVSYVFGTIHLIKSESFFYPKGTLKAFEEVNEVFFEIDMNEMSDMSKMMGLMDKLYMPDGQSLNTLLSDEDYQLVTAHFKKMGLPIFMFERMKPMFLTVFASEDMDFGGMMSPGSNNAQVKSYEFEFLELAKTMNKNVSGLETIEFQMSIFDRIPYKDQAQMLVESIKSSDDENNQMEEITRIYISQDIDAMVNMMDDESMGVGEYEDILLKERNENWIPIMETQMKQESTFFAVGAGHLGGKNGVINLLKAAGYTLTPVSTAD